MAQADDSSQAMHSPPLASVSEPVSEPASAFESASSSFSFPSTAVCSSDDESSGLQQDHPPMPAFSLTDESPEYATEIFRFSSGENDPATVSSLMAGKDCILDADQGFNNVDRDSEEADAAATRLSSGENDAEICSSSMAGENVHQDSGGCVAPDRPDATGDVHCSVSDDENGSTGSSCREPSEVPRRTRRRHGILGQLAAKVDSAEVDRHCDVLDLLRKGIQNWRTVARMSGWLGCCHKPGSCCHSASSPAGGHARTESQDTNASTSSACCAMKSASTPLRSPKALPFADELTVHVPPGMIGLAWLDSEPLLLTSKSYSFPAASFSLQELALESTRVIHHGSLHRVLISEGKLGVAWVDGQAEVLEPGIHVWSCSSFVYSTADDRDASEKEVALGPFRVVTVKDDEVGVKYCNRKAQLLYVGRHLIDISKVEVFAGFESLRIRKTTASDLAACSRDEIMVEAQVSFRWQIAPQDIAFARAASVADIEGAVVTKLRRAFAIVFWCLKGEEIVGSHALLKEDAMLISGPMQAFSAEISKKCLEAVADLFEEGWRVTFWGMWFERLKLRRYSRVRPVRIQQHVQQESSSTIGPRKKRVQIVLAESPSRQ